MSIITWLSQVDRLYIETTPLIYYIEENPNYVDMMERVFQHLIQTEQPIFTATVTLTEVLVQPLRRGDHALVQNYRDILLNSDNIVLMNIQPTVAETAARLRAQYNLRTLDALHLGAAVGSRCDAFLTNDAKLTRVNELAVRTLDSFR